MSRPDLADSTSHDAILAALADSEPSWVTLPPPRAEVSDTLRAALEALTLGTLRLLWPPTAWLKTQALDAYESSRTRLLIAERRVAGFYSLASAQVALSQRDRRDLSIDPVRVSAALVTWIAKDARADIDGKLLLLHAVATARRAAGFRPRQCSSWIPSTMRLRPCGVADTDSVGQPNTRRRNACGYRCRPLASGYGPAAQARRGKCPLPRGTYCTRGSFRAASRSALLITATTVSSSRFERVGAVFAGSVEAMISLSAPSTISSNDSAASPALALIEYPLARPVTRRYDAYPRQRRPRP